MPWCDLCNQENLYITVYPCTHKFHPCCAKKFLKINHNCPICKNMDDIMFPIEYIKQVQIST